MDQKILTELLRSSRGRGRVLVSLGGVGQLGGRRS